jgi:hypothetical protein
MAMTSVSVMMTVFVLNLHYRGPKKNEIPHWLQQLLSLSLANTAQSIRRSKKVKIVTNNNRDGKSRKKSPRETSRKARSATSRTPTNGILSSYTNINETRVKTRLTTDVSTLLRSTRFERDLCNSIPFDCLETDLCHFLSFFAFVINY